MKPLDKYKTSLRWGEAESSTKKTFVCFGTVRGGTSAVAGTMRMLGVYMGDCPGNNHEDPAFVAKPNSTRMRAIEERNAKFDIWGWKDPRAANYLPAVYDALINPHYICVYRDCVAIGIAHARWHKREAQFALADIVTQHQKNIMWLIGSTSPCLLISYEKMIAAPTAFANELADFLGVDMTLDPDALATFLAPGAYKDLVTTE